MTRATPDGRRPLAERMLRAIARERLIPRGGRVLAALSGGADSVALSTLLADAAPAGGYVLAGLLHVNHRLRGGAAEADEAFCRTLAERLRVPIVVERVDVAALARADGVSIEHAGHRARYAIFERVASEQGADAVATGHTQDDLAETVLLRLVRGAGPGGLAGIRPRAGRVVRPLLGVSRRELREHLAARGVPHREDASNRDLRVPRNRVRHRLLPLLAQEFSPAIVEVLAREAAIARADADWIDGVANERAAAVVRYGEGSAAINRAALCAEPPAVARRIARAALERVSGRGAGFAHVERLLDLAALPGVAPDAGRGDAGQAGPATGRGGEAPRWGDAGRADPAAGEGGQVPRRAGPAAGGGGEASRRADPAAGRGGEAHRRADFPGCRAERRGDRLVLRRSAAGRPAAADRRPAVAGRRPAVAGRRATGAADGFEYRLDVPGEVAVPEAGLAISAAPAAAAPAPLRARGAAVAVAAAGLTSPLTVRSRRPGDAFRPLGLGGRKKLQDFFVDRKVARDARGTIPIVADDRRGIVWVVGHGLSEDVRVPDAPAAVLILRSRKLGGLV